MAGGIINTGTHPKLLWPGIHATWGQEYAEHPEEYTQLYTILSSDRAYEEDVQITGFGLAPIKQQGAAGTYDSELQGIITRYQHIAYALGYMVTKEELEDNQYEIVSSRRAKANAFSMRQTIETVSAALYNNAFSSASYTTGDGVALCSSAHLNASGGTYSNILSPAADLAESSIEDLTIQIMNTLNDRGNFISLMPTSLHVSTKNWYVANRIMQSALQSNTANNNINVIKATGVFPNGVQMSHYFTAPQAWFIRTNCPNGMQFFWRNRPEFTQDNDFDTKNAKALSYMRFSVGATDPRGIFGSNGP